MVPWGLCFKYLVSVIHPVSDWLRLGFPCYLS